MRLIKFILLLLVLGAAALVGYAYLADMRPEQREITRPLDIPGQSAPPAVAPAQGTAPAPAQGTAPAPAQGAADAN